MEQINFKFPYWSTDVLPCPKCLFDKYYLCFIEKGTFDHWPEDMMTLTCCRCGWSLDLKYINWLQGNYYET